LEHDGITVLAKGASYFHMKNKLMIIFWDLGIGGIQRLIIDLITTISHKYHNWDVFIVLRRRSAENFESLITDEKQVRVIVYPYDKKSPVLFGFILWNILQFISIKPNVILTFLPVLSVMYIFINKLIFWIPCKVVVNEQSITSLYLSTRGLEWLNVFVRYFYNLADLVITPTKAGVEDLISNYRLRASLIRLIPNWTLINPLTSHKHVNIDLLFVGRLEFDKNPLLLLEIMRKLEHILPHLKIVMVGCGSMEKDIRRLISEYKLKEKVFIKGFTVHPEHYYAKARILLLPSVIEGMPFVVLEAAMYGIPAIISDFKGADEVVIHNKTGYIAKDTNDYLKYIRILLKSETIRRNLGQNATNYIKERYSDRTQTRFIKAMLNLS
jgi:glycosyltransferase involved in cell wall biosynthesis